MAGVVTWSVIAVLVAVGVVVAAVWGPTIWTSHEAGTSVSTPAGVATSGSPVSSSPTPIGVSSASLVRDPGIDPAKLASAVASVKTARLGTISGEVVDLGTGKVVYASGATRPMLPASSLKVLTTSAVLDVLGPGHRFTTSVVRSGNSIVLVGGGDPYLASTMPKQLGGNPAPPTLSSLADRTAKALKAAGVTTVRLGFDDSLFSGPSWHSSWPASYRDQVTHISALWADEGDTTGVRSAAPAQAAADIFASQLKARGIKVTAKVARANALEAASPLASVTSWPLSTIVEQTLVHSNNSAAEVLLRQLAVAAHQKATFSGGVAALQAELTKLGLWDEGARLVDGSGLSRDDKVTAGMLARAVSLANRTPSAYPVLNGMPVAGVTGTLQSRFYLDRTQVARGVAHAKTGTLTHVSTFTGWTRTADGAVVAYAFLVNGAGASAQDNGKSVGTNDWNMRNHLDLVVSAITGCRCAA